MRFLTRMEEDKLLTIFLLIHEGEERTYRKVVLLIYPFIFLIFHGSHVSLQEERENGFEIGLLSESLTW